MEIVLVRHGKPTGAVNPKLSVLGFAHWLRTYRQAKLAPNSVAPEALQHSLTEHFIVTSKLARAIDSAQRCVGRAPNLQLSVFTEMPIPCYKLPFRLHAYSWLVMSRIAWFAGFSGKVESFENAKLRAKQGAVQLQQLAKTHGKVVLFGHGMINKYIAKELYSLGWKGSVQGSKYWSASKFTQTPNS